MQIKFTPTTSGHNTALDLLKIKGANRLNMLLSVQSQTIQNQGEISGIKQQQQDALDNQQKNEEEYKKEQRHRILHAIVSIFAHVINLVMTIIRPVKHLAKAARKGISKAINKGLHKATGGLLRHMGAAKPMKRVAGGAKKAIKGSSAAKRPAMKVVASEAKKFAKRTAVINGVSGGLNGIGDGVFKIQTGKIKNAIDNLENNIDLISANFTMTENMKKDEQDNIKAQVDKNVDMRKNVQSTINTIGNMQAHIMSAV
ncbi:hypothetical protein QNN88_10180 [Citrobacter sp. ANG330]|uniref:hypothetical protein n=1 Tax=Citrobacter sp. ANG330 TaxID=3048142 RepID=UPI0039C0C3C5